MVEETTKIFKLQLQKLIKKWKKREKAGDIATFFEDASPRPFFSNIKTVKKVERWRNLHYVRKQIFKCIKTKIV